MVNVKKLKDVEIELKLINELQRNNDQSQRSISKELNVALGLANSLIKRFVKKGFLKLSEAPMKRYIYYLTPKGLLEKTKLTSEYIQNSLEFYKKIKLGYELELKKIRSKKNYNIILVGISELTEIAVLVANLNNVKISFIYDESSKLTETCGIKVKKTISKSKKNILILTESKNPILVLSKLKKTQLNEVIVPDFLMVR